MEVWEETFRDAMLEKYETIEIVKPRIKYLLSLVLDFVLVEDSRLCTVVRRQNDCDWFTVIANEFTEFATTVGRIP
jgi:hypothetical protein